MWSHDAQHGDPAIRRPPRLRAGSGRRLQQSGGGTGADLGAAARLAGPVVAVRGRAVGAATHAGGRRMRNAVGPGRLGQHRQPRRRGRPDRDDPLQGHRRQDRLAGHQPRRPGGVGRGGRRLDGGHAARRRAAALRPGRFRSARVSRTRTPALWCNTDADNDRLRADNASNTRPKGVAHIEAETKEFVQRCVDKMGKDFLANVGTASVVKDLDAHPGRARRRQADLPRATRTAPGSVRATPRPTPNMCAR